jgi:hypothetical protein
MAKDDLLSIESVGIILACILSTMCGSILTIQKGKFNPYSAAFAFFLCSVCSVLSGFLADDTKKRIDVMGQESDDEDTV